MKSFILFFIVFFNFLDLDAQLKINYFSENSENKNIISTWKNKFDDKQFFFTYLDSLYNDIKNKGYIHFSIDSIISLNDSFLNVYTFWGEKFLNANIIYEKEDSFKLINIAKEYKTKPNNLLYINDSLDKIINEQYVSKGFITNSIYADSLIYKDGKLLLKNKIYNGKLYQLDSLKIIGDLNLQYGILCKLLNFNKGEYITPTLIKTINSQIKLYDFFVSYKSPEIIFDKDKATLGLFLNSRNTNQANVIIGVMPNNSETKKLLVTGDATIKLKNAFALAENINLTWQQLQYQSPRLNIDIDFPFLFQTNFGLLGAFNFFKKDSTFRNISYKSGINYFLSPQKFLTFLYKSTQSNILNIDTNTLKTYKSPSSFIDFKSKTYTISLNFNNTDEIFSPKKGILFVLDLALNQRKIIQNEIIYNLTNNYGQQFKIFYDSLTQKNNQFIISLDLKKYIQLNKSFTLLIKNLTYFNSSKFVFKNEVPQMGGINTLRGYDEQQFYCRNYSIASTELHYNINKSSFFTVFYNIGWLNYYVENTLTTDLKNGFGAGLNFSTENGIFSIYYALGQSNDDKFVIRNAKIHFGYISKF